MHSRRRGPRGATLPLALLALASLSAALLLRVHPGGPAGPQTIRVGRNPSAIAVASASGRLVVANEDDGTLSLLDARSGALLRTVPLGQHPTALALDEAAGRVFTLNTTLTTATAALPYPATVGVATLSVLDLHTGALLRTVPAGASPTVLAVDEPGGRLVVASSGDDTVRLLDARTGQVLRTVALNGRPQSVAVAPAAGRVFVSIEGRQGRVVMVDSRTGRLVRTLTLGQPVGAVVAVPHAGRLVVSSDGQLQLRDLHSGALVGTVHAAVVPLQPTAGGQVLVRGRAGLRLLDARTGRWAGPWVLSDRAVQLVWSEDVAPDSRSGTVVVAVQPARGPSALAVLNGHSGRVRRLIPVGPAVGALAVDARTHTAFVLPRRRPCPDDRTPWRRCWPGGSGGGPGSGWLGGRARTGRAPQGACMWSPCAEPARVWPVGACGWRMSEPVWWPGTTSTLI